MKSLQLKPLAQLSGDNYCRFCWISAKLQQFQIAHVDATHGMGHGLHKQAREMVFKIQEMFGEWKTVDMISCVNLELMRCHAPRKDSCKFFRIDDCKKHYRKRKLFRKLNLNDRTILSTFCKRSLSDKCVVMSLFTVTLLCAQWQQTTA